MGVAYLVLELINQKYCILFCILVYISWWIVELLLLLNCDVDKKKLFCCY